MVWRPPWTVLCRIRDNSDRGIQSTSKLFKEMTEDMIDGYSAKVNPWHNAYIEYSYDLIKRELINRFKTQDYHHAYRSIFEHIEGLYSTARIHSQWDHFITKSI